MHSVQVLLSTYNGEKFLRQQLDSILSQSNVNLQLLIRDDGSTDRTLDILSEYVDHHANIELVKGDNIGYKASFMWLVQNSGDFDFFAFADQDDIWLQDKLSRAADRISDETGKNRPVFYCSNCTLVDTEGVVQGVLHSGAHVVPESTEEAFTTLYAYGCTVVFTRSSRNLVLEYAPKERFSHDFWIATVHLFLADIVYDDYPRILHRQHGGNVFGGKRILKQTLFKLRHIKDDLNVYQKLATEVLAGYGDKLAAEDRQFLNSVKSYRTSFSGKWNLILNPRLKRKSLAGTLYIKTLVLFSMF